MSQINHELEAGDELTDNQGTTGTIDTVRSDGSVLVNWEDGKEVHAHNAIVNALIDGTVKRADGKSHELVKSF